MPSDLPLAVPLGQNTEHERIALPELLLRLLRRDGAVGQHLLSGFFGSGFPVLGLVLRFLIRGQRFLQLLRRREDRIGFAFRDQFLRVDLIDLLPHGLTERSVRSAVGDGSVLGDGGAFVEQDVIVRQRADERLRRARNLPARVGVFDPEIQNTAGLMRQPFIDHHLIHPAEMHESGRTRRKTGHFRTFGQSARRVALLDVLGGLCHVRIQQIRHFLVIHTGSAGRRCRRRSFQKDS